ncbi:MAG TPA: hypothetical protein VL401_01945 [Alphaproteobacteria bacterium]|jgi:ADP-ribose pyrophosphatase YjhB (NUDIX family)|nr:hypothetical protein [Alphaproteobacteria bacterium]
MHRIQKILLKRLLVKNNQIYSSLTSGYNFEDNIVFHLKQLISKGFIKKESSHYFLTAKGTREITNYDLNSLQDSGFKNFFIGFVCKCGDNYLIKGHPNGKSNFFNFPSGKPKFGENIDDALVRTFYENTKLKLKFEDFKYISLHLKTVKTSSGETLFDDAFAIYEVNISESQKAKMKLAKNINWFSVDEIKVLKNLWPEIDILLLESNKQNYLVYEFTSNYILD